MWKPERIRGGRTDIQVLAAVALAAPLGATVVPLLTERGLTQLRCPEALAPRLRGAAALAGAGAGVMVGFAGRHTGAGTTLLALLVWAYCLAGAACCDLATQRVPTPLVRQGGAMTAVLILLAAIATHDLRGLLLAAVAAAGGGLLLAGCWRYAGAGFGDVRLAVLGGLGLGHTSAHALTWAVGGFSLLTVAQAWWTMAHGGTRHTRFAMGPALTVGYLLAAAI